MIPDLRHLRIGYVPFRPTLEAPGDRRRFCYYAAKRDIRFEIARPSEAYDVVVLTQAADISVWRHHPRGRGKIIFDFTDSYLSIPKLDPQGLLRGVAKFAFRQNQELLLNYSAGLEDMCRRADATICTTEEQKKRIVSFCQNVHIILDFHGSVVRECKQQYSSGEVFHFVWEGLPYNVPQLFEIKEALEGLRAKRRFTIHIITDLEYRRFLNGRIGKRNTLDQVRNISSDICLYAWNERTVSAIARSCDMALIPIPLGDPLLAGKPENRLLLFWRMGIPVLASATAAHKRAMEQCGLDMACASQQEWLDRLDFYVSSEQARQHAGQCGKAFAETMHSEEKTLAVWDQVFRSILV